MWSGAHQGVPVQGGEEAAGLLDGPGLQVRLYFQNLFMLIECWMPKQASPLQHGSRSCRVEPGHNDREFKLAGCRSCRGGGG